MVQAVLTAVLLFSLPLWKKGGEMGGDRQPAGRALSLGEIFRIPGALQIIACFFCYCALEQTTGLWASSYMTLYRGISAETAASFTGMFYIGITAGRALSGFITMRFSDTQMIRMGQAVIGAGVLTMLLPFGKSPLLIGLVLIGLGCAPIYPCIIHSTPSLFGADRSQAIIGVQMASAYVGSCLMPPLFGLLARAVSVSLFPWYLLAVLAVMAVMHGRLTCRARHRS